MKLLHSLPHWARPARVRRRRPRRRTYPSRTVTVVVPFPAGGSVDGVARILVQKLNETLGQQLHRGEPRRRRRRHGRRQRRRQGGARRLHAAVHGLDPRHQAVPVQELPYDVVKDFTPVSLLAAGPLVVSTDAERAGEQSEGILRPRAQGPAEIHLRHHRASARPAISRIELLKRDAGVDTLVIAYKGAGPALTDLMGGQIQLIADPMLSSLPLAQAGKIKALASPASSAWPPRRKSRPSRSPA